MGAALTSFLDSPRPPTSASRLNRRPSRTESPRKLVSAAPIKPVINGESRDRVVLVSLDLLLGIGRRGGDRAVGYTGGWFESYELADGGVAGLPRVDPPTWAIKGCSAAIRAGLPSSAPASITTTPPSLPPPPSPNSGSLPLLGCRYPNPSGRFSNDAESPGWMPNTASTTTSTFGDALENLPEGLGYRQPRRGSSLSQFRLATPPGLPISQSLR
jgi:hypothetical protein